MFAVVEKIKNEIKLCCFCVKKNDHAEYILKMRSESFFVPVQKLKEVLN